MLFERVVELSEEIEKRSNISKDKTLKDCMSKLGLTGCLT